MTKKYIIFLMAILLIFPNIMFLNGCLNTTKSYQITVSTDYSNMGNVYGSGTFKENTQIIIAAAPKEGYEFEKWNDGNTEPIRTIVVTQHKYFSAKFKKIDTVIETKYVLDSVEVGVYGIDSKIESILLQELYIKTSQGNINCINLTGGESSYYLGEGGLTLYNEDGYGHAKQYTSNDPLTIYAQRNEYNSFTDAEYVHIKYRTYEDYDETVSSSGAGKGLSEWVQIDPLGNSNIFDINLHNSTMTIKLKFVKI